MLRLLKAFIGKGFSNFLAGSLLPCKEKEVVIKTVKFLSAIVTLIVVTVSCTTTQRAFEDDYDDEIITQQSVNRVYVQDPFYGTVILERDPFSGRYYDVTNGYGKLNSPSYGRNNYRRYGGNYNRGYGNRPVIIQKPGFKPSPRQPPVNREDARKNIPGNGN